MKILHTYSIKGVRNIDNASFMTDGSFNTVVLVVN